MRNTWIRVRRGHATTAHGREHRGPFRHARRFVTMSLCVLVLVGSQLEPASANTDAAARVNANAIAPSKATTHCANGVDAFTLTPPAGFNPLTATDQELVANNLPPRPASGKALAVWQHFVTTDHPTKPSCTSATGHVQTNEQVISAPHRTTADSESTLDGTGASTNWDGNIANDQSYTDAETWFTVPIADNTVSDAYSCSWVGVGSGETSTGADDAAQPMIQAGSESDTRDGEPYYYIWWELYPQLQTQQVVSSNVHPGDTIYVHAHLSYDDDWVVVEDETTGEGASTGYGVPTAKSGNIWPDNQAEWIYERTEIDSDFPMLSDASTTFEGNDASGTGYGFTPLADLPHAYSPMVDCVSQKTLAWSGPISSDDSTFTAYWSGYGNVTPRKDC